MKRIYLKLCILFYFVLSISDFNIVFAQSLARESISSLGNAVLLQNISISQTVGQPYSLNSVQLTSHQLFPGFQQSFLMEDSDEQLNYSMSIFPNPCEYTFKFSLINSTNTEALVSLYDVTGAKVWSAYQQLNQEIDVSAFRPGLYTFQCIIAGKSQSEQLIIIK